MPKTPLAPNEDLSFGGNDPNIDLTPESLWGGGGFVKETLGAKTFAQLEGFVSARADHVCELCGAGPKTKGKMGQKAHKFRMEPRFQYNPDETVVLRRLMYICEKCAQCIHLAQTLAMSRNMGPRGPIVAAVARLRQLLDITDDEIRKRYKEQHALWESRAPNPAHVDMSVAIDGAKRVEDGLKPHAT